MIVRALKTFRDLKAGRLRTEGEEFEADAERVKALNSTKYGKLVQEAEKPVEAPKPRRRRSKE